MKNNRLLYLLVIILFIYCLFLNSKINNLNASENTINQYEIEGISSDLSEVVEKVKSSVVTITCNNVINSGFIYKQVDNKVYVLTCYHGISENNINVNFLDVYSTKANLIGKDIYSDLALLEIELPYEVTPLKLADCLTLKAGEFGVVLGTPLKQEFSTSVNLAMISKPRCTIENNISLNLANFSYYLDMIEISCDLHNGNSGSPLINMNGQVLGMITMKDDDNICLALTSNEIKIIAEKLLANQEVNKYQLGIKGIYLSEMENYIKSALNISIEVINGLYVSDILLDSRAYYAGIKKNDLIISINDKEITNFNDYLEATYTSDELLIKLVRDNETLEITVKNND